MNLGKTRSRGFTLIELLIVIAIIAILAVIVVLAINPASILAKSKDSQRMSDMTTLATALNLYLADNQAMPADAGSPVDSSACITNAQKNACRKNDGTGWITGYNFTNVTSGAPIAALPLDPANDANNYYSFAWNSTAKTYEINCTLETQANADQMATDGGNDPAKYEVGTNLTLI